MHESTQQGLSLYPEGHKTVMNGDLDKWRAVHHTHVLGLMAVIVPSTWALDSRHSNGTPRNILKKYENKEWGILEPDFPT